MTNEQILEDLFMVVRHHLMGKDVQSTIANVVASKVVKGAECMEVEDIRKLRDLFIAQEVIIMKYAMMSIAFVLPVAFGFAENALIWYNLIAGIVCWVLSVYSFCK